MPKLKISNPWADIKVNDKGKLVGVLTDELIYNLYPNNSGSTKSSILTTVTNSDRRRSSKPF